MPATAAPRHTIPFYMCTNSGHGGGATEWTGGWEWGRDGRAEILRERRRGEGSGRGGTTLPAPTHYVPSGVSMPAALHARTAAATRTAPLPPGTRSGGRRAQCRRRPDSGESCVASASVRRVPPQLARVVRRVSVAVVARRGRTWGAPPQPPPPPPVTTTTMKKHSEQLAKRLAEQQRSPTADGGSSSSRRRSSKCCKNGILKNESSPELSRTAARKSRQYFLEPIRRWNSFHNSRERKCTAAAATATPAQAAAAAAPTASSASNLPYLQTLVNLQRESRSACARLAQSVLPKLPRGAESAPVLGSCAAAAASARSPLSSFQQSATGGTPTRKQNSSPNLLSVCDRRQQAAVTGAAGGGGSSLTNSPRRLARRPKTPPSFLQQQLAAGCGVDGGDGTDASGSSKIPFAIIVGDTPVGYRDIVPRIKAIRADSVSEKPSQLAAASDLSPQRRYSFWSVIARERGWPEFGGGIEARF